MQQAPQRQRNKRTVSRHHSFNCIFALTTFTHRQQSQGHIHHQNHFETVTRGEGESSSQTFIAEPFMNSSTNHSTSIITCIAIGIGTHIPTVLIIMISSENTDKMKDRAWGDHWDEATGEKLDLNPHIPKPEPPKEEEKKEDSKRP